MVKNTMLNSKYFGEGSTILNGKIYVLTWTDRKILTFDTDLNLLDERALPKQISEGWGLTHDQTHLYITDGSSRIYIMDPDSYEVLSFITVYDTQGRPVSRLNELEMVDNKYIYSN